MTERDPLNVVGQVVDGKYRIERFVGEGGFAVVYRAEHQVWKKPVALKLFSGLSTAPPGMRADLQQSFINEGALLTELSTQSSNIVQARDVGTYTTPDGQWMPYMVLEWLDGMSLDDALEQERSQGAGPWSIEEAFRCLEPLARALQVAHGRGVAHRDIKPANFFVVGGVPRSGSATMKLLDFGVAKMVTDNTQMQAAMARTGANITSFTPQYGAPEQFSRTHGATGAWTDVFAFALVMVELLVGRAAMQGLDVVQLAFESGNPQRRPSPKTLGAPVTDAVESVFLKALAVSPQERFQNVAEFWDALGAAITGGRAVGTTQPLHGALDQQQTVLAPASMPFSTPMSVTTPAAGGGKGAVAVGALIAAAGLAAGAWFVLRPGAVPAPSATAVAVLTPPASASAPPAKATCSSDIAQIPAGQFFMGSTKDDAAANQKPAHNVTLSAFCIDLHEVTTAQYKACSDVGKCLRAGEDVTWPDITDTDKAAYSPLCNVLAPEERGDHPINCVTWQQADVYCKANDKRLPTEAEWEYATRGPDGRTYPWGDEDPTPAHLNACGAECVKWGKGARVKLDALFDTDDGFAATAPVGKFPGGKSRFGPFDVVGNVWEWVGDWYADYDDAARENPTGPSNGEKRVIRGGAWNGGYASWLHPSFRYAQVPTARNAAIGFRCAKPL